MNINLKVAILQSGKTQVELAHEIGMREVTLTRIIHGWHRPTDEEKRSSAKALGCKVEEIFPENGGRE